MKYKIVKQFTAVFICLFLFLNISDNVYSQLTYITCNSACPGNLVGKVTFANKNGITTGRWTLDDISYGGLADEKFEVADTAAFKFTNGNVQGTPTGGTYSIVSNPNTVNGPSGTPLMNEPTDGIFLFRSINTNNFAKYTIKGLQVGGKYCVRVKMSNPAPYVNCNQTLYTVMQFRSLTGVGISGGGTSGGQWNLVSNNAACKPSTTGAWDGNNQNEGIKYHEYVSVYEINFQIGQNPNNTNDNGFTLFFKPQTWGTANDVWGIDEIDVYGCITQQINSSNGTQICNGTPTVLTAMGIGSTTDTYEWRIGNSSGTKLQDSTNSISVTPAAATTYWVKCLRTNVPLTTTISPVSCCGPNGLFTVPKICEAINVDGIMDTISTEKVWSMAPWIIVDGNKSLSLVGTNDCGGNGVQEKPAARWRTVYDNTNMYFIIQVFDDNPSNTQGAGNYYWMDGVEFYLKDAGGNPKQFGAGYSLASDKGYGNLTNVIHKIVKSSTFWTMEVSIPLATNNIDVLKGFLEMEVGINQSKDATTCRAAQVFTWIAANHYSSASQYHVSPLSDCASAIASEDTLCSGGSTILSTQLTTINNSPLYTWQSSATGATGSFTNVIPSPGSSNSVNVSPSGTTFYRAINDGVATCPVQITFPNLNIGASADATSFCPGATMTLTGTTTETGVQWGWKKGATFNTSTFISGYTLSNDVTKKIYSKTFASGDEGNYYFVVSKNNCGPNSLLTISLSSTPTVTASGDSRCGTGLVNLTATASSGTISWYTAATGGTSIGNNSPWTTPSCSKDSTFYAEAAVGTCVSARSSAVAKINAVPTITATGSSRNGPGTVVLTATPSPSNSTINWYSTTTGGTIIGTGSPWTTPSISSNTTYYAEAVDGSCISDTRASAIASISIIPTITAKGDSICGTGTAVLTAIQSSGIINWYSTASGGIIIGTGSPWTTPSISSNTTYYAEAVDGTNVSVTRAAATVTVNSLPNVNATGGTICSGNTQNISASGAINYSWSNNGGTNFSVSVNPTTSSTYTVTGTDANQCSNTANAVVNVNNLPTVTAGGGGTICSGKSISISANGATTYNWNNGQGSGTPKLVSPISSTTYSVTGTDGQSCSNTANVVVTVNDLPKVSAIGGEINSGIPIAIIASGANTYVWSDSLGTNDTIIISPIATTTYTVTGTDLNNCSNVAFAIVKVVEKTKIWVPSAFSPNEDGKNDLLVIFSEFKCTIHFEIYNQWGILVCTYDGQLNGSPVNVWDGKYKGIVQPEGNYIYVLNAVGDSNKKVIDNGTITLLR